MSNIKKEITKAFQFRYACKKFDSEKVISDEDFHIILEAGRLSPSSYGFEPWKFLIIQNQALRKKLFPIAWGARNSLTGASHFVIFLARRAENMMYNSNYIKNLMLNVQKLSADAADKKEVLYKNWLTNDFSLLGDEQAMFDWSSKQTYIALANMMTVGAFLEIDSCPIEGFNRKAVDELLEKEGLIDTKDFGVSVMAGFGYRGENQRHEKTRQKFDDVIQWIK